MTPATPTEAHQDLAITLTGRHYSISEAAQLIAESEARAVADIVSRLQSAFHAPLIAERDALRAEVNQAQVDCAVMAVQANEAIARAEKAEAELATLRTLHASEKQAKIERGEMLCECQAELASERARLDWLEKYGATPICSRSAIDAAMQSNAK